jgi:nucleotide-binding universal stress UspA family protein
VFSRILVPLDGSLLAEHTIAHAEQFAKVFGGSITLLQVLDPTPFHESRSTVEPLNWQIRKAEAEMYLQGVAGKIRDGGIPVDYAIQEGCAPDKIIDFAHSENVELVVLSTHGISGLSRWNTSSVTNKVLEKIYLPVLLVRAYLEMGNIPAPQPQATRVESNPQIGLQIPEADCGSVAAAGVPAENRPDVYSPFSYRRILLPIDSSRRAECALPAATGLAKAQQEDPATIIISAVISPPDLPIPDPFPEEIHQSIDRFMRLSRSAVESYLNEMSQRMEGMGETRVVEASNIAGALHEMAETENVDLVVLCAHGRTGGTSYPYGSVARNYLEYGTKPVLVIQDVPLAQVRPTAVEQAIEKYGRR